MTLHIEIRENTNQAVKDLKKICPDPNISFDFSPSAENIPSSTARVDYPQRSVDTVGCRVVELIVKSPNHAVIHPVTSGFRFKGKPMTEWNAATGQSVPVSPADAGTPVAGLPPRLADVYYDATNNLGYGYWVEDEAGKHIPTPTHVTLFHELVHAREVTSATASLDPDQPWEDREAVALKLENDYRASCTPKLPQRHGYEGGVNDRGGGDCFIATAAYGSPTAPEVELLRRFRDDVLRKTRYGDDFFETYWEQYYRLSPTIVDMMRGSPELQETVRWSLVEPIVEYLRIALDFPDAPLDGVPEPWDTFLGQLRDMLESWAGNISPPSALDELAPTAAAEELAIALRYLFRHPESRQAFLRRLLGEGELPLEVSGDEQGEVEAILRAHSRSQAEIDLIIGGRERVEHGGAGQ